MPIPHTYLLRTDRASRTLKGLKNTALYMCETAVRVGEASPAAVIAELRGVANYLAVRWQGKARHEVLQMEWSRGEP